MEESLDSEQIFVFLIPAITGIFMFKQKWDYSFWTKYKHFAVNEILLYLIMVVGILLGILIFS